MAVGIHPVGTIKVTIPSVNGDGRGCIIMSKNALVTGSGKGIGMGIALSLAESGYDIGIHYCVNREGAEKISRMIRDMGRKSVVLQADLQHVDQIRRMFDQYFNSFECIDLLVNNAGITRMVPFLETTEETFDEILDTDLKGPFFCAQAAARNMVEKETRGVIINISSNNSVGCWPMASVYGAAKAGMNKMGRNMALEMAKYGIRIVTVAPGYTNTNYEQQEPNEYAVKRSARIPLGRFCTPGEIGKAIVFLASEDAGYITGTELFMDGGALLPVLPENTFV